MKVDSKPWTHMYTHFGEISMYVLGVYVLMKKSPYRSFCERRWLVTYTPAIRAHGVWYAWRRIAGGHTCTASSSLKLQNAGPAQWLVSDFGGPIFTEKGNKIYYLAANDRFYKYPTACIYDKANGPNVLRFSDMYIENHGVPRSIRLDQAKFSVGNQ